MIAPMEGNQLVVESFEEGLLVFGQVQKEATKLPKRTVKMTAMIPVEEDPVFDCRGQFMAEAVLQSSLQ